MLEVGRQSVDFIDIGGFVYSLMRYSLYDSTQ